MVLALALIARAQSLPAAPSAETVPAGLVGTWVLIGGDYLLRNEYRADGTMVQYVHGSTKGTKPSKFRIEGSTIIVSLRQPGGSIFESRTRFEIAGDRLYLWDLEAEKRVFRRELKSDGR